MASTTSKHDVPREDAAARAASCVGWLALFGLLGIFATALVTVLCSHWGDQDNARRSRALMAEQMEQIRQGKIHCLVQPAPDCVGELLADASCAANIREVYLGGDVSDERLGRLRELPNLRCVVLLFAENLDILLERLQGLATLEELTLEGTWPSRRGIEFINSFPKLKSLCLPVVGHEVASLEGIKSHPSLENLVLGRIGCDDRVLPLLRSLPRLRSVTIEDAERDEKAFEELLRKTLPNCQCSVRLGP